VKRNVVFNNTDAGIQVMNNSCNNLIEENEIRLNEWSGISLWHANENTIVNNSACYNVINIWLKDSNRCLIKGNNASYALKKCGIGLENSRHNRVEENVANGNAKVGILLKYSSIANEVKDNKANFNSKGIFIGFSSDNNTLSNNTASNNEHGIHLWRSSNNVIYLNNFINNTENVYSYESTNIWNFTSPITYTYKGKPYMNYLGNYWDDYKEKYPDAEEIDGKGIWNEAYSIDGDKDYYPLMVLWENYFGVYKQGLNITITTDKTEYSPGDYVHLNQQFTNENEESVIITNPITVTFIAPDGSVVLQEDLGISVYITLWKGGKYSLGYSFKLPDDAPEGHYDARASISGGNYVKTVEDLFFVEAGSLT
jgi:parallel beta-helix repeat protein